MKKDERIQPRARAKISAGEFQTALIGKTCSLGYLSRMTLSPEFQSADLDSEIEGQRREAIVAEQGVELSVGQQTQESEIEVERFLRFH